jgi:cob(I)alamin adenosyltransferase
MVVLNRIYTRTGDKGETALGNGDRVAKCALRVSAYGTIDETNATVGLARQHSSGDMDDMLVRIQNDLFDLGADLCRPDMEKDAKAEYPPLRVTPAQTLRLEAEIDAMNAHIAPLRSFVLPGGSALAANLHLCRTTCRRAERLIVELAQSEHINQAALTYVNRLSDWFFVASRAANNNGQADVLWVPGANRQA